MSGKRVLALYAVILFGFAVVLCRIYFLAQNPAYAARAEAQSTVSLALPTRRGNFYDCNGLPLTGLEMRWQTLCFPGENNYPRLYSETDSTGQATLYQNRNRAAPFLLETMRDLSSLGLRCFPAAKRYASVPLCQHLIGYLDADGHGAAGLEKALDDLLAGTGAHDTLRCAVTAQGRLREGETPQLIQNDSGAVGVQLTISRPVQRAAEAVAAETMTSGCILVLDVQTAAVRASVSVPGYDPDDLAASLGASDSPFLNRALESYAVGSVFKPVLAAAALEAGLSPEYECTGAVVVDGQIFRCAGGVPHGTVNLAEALEKSCNVTFAELSYELGKSNMQSVAENFGFNDNFSFSDLVLYNSSYPGDISSVNELAWSGVGQGRVLVTPLHMAMIASGVGNGGVMMEPKLVRQITGAAGIPRLRASGGAYKRVMSEATAKIVGEYMRETVENGTGKKARVSGYTVCGKTGSAETSNDKSVSTNAWFVGYIQDASCPYAVAVVLEQAGAGGDLAATLAAKCLAEAVELVGGQG